MASDILLPISASYRGSNELVFESNSYKKTTADALPKQ